MSPITRPRLRIATVLFLLLLASVFIAQIRACGYQSCPKPKPGFLNVHLVPHSHDDVGWLKTVDQYYYGAKNFVQQASVKYLLDSTIDELEKDPTRRFIYVETGFFWRWWTNQAPERQTVVRKMIASGQLEFINGGWCMNDEATAHYNEIIDQMSLGLRYLNDTFGECALPRVAWQIDPFGHSREQASLFAQMGFDGLFFGRLDYQDKFNRRMTQNMETIWNGSPHNLGKAASLFTGVLYNGYNPPDGFCFDIFCGDEPIMDDPKLLGYNLDKKIQDFINASKIWAAPYRTGNVMMTMGSDFQYLSARAWYDNLDKLIRNVNARQASDHSRVNVFYSTPSCYLQAVHDAGLTWSTKSDDFFPYASDPNAFWSGYFTSRPALKYYVHKTNNFLQVCKQLAAIADGSESILERVFKLAEPVAVTQHHDAVAGTAKQHVTDDYSLRLSIGVESCEQVISSAIMSLQYKSEKNLVDHIALDLETFHNSISFNAGDINFCQNLNISSCYASESMNEFILSVYNPLARYLNDTNVRIPVTTPHWKVEARTGEVPSEVIDIPDSVFKIPGRESSTAYYELVFPVLTLAPLSLTQFRITRLRASHKPKIESPQTPVSGNDPQRLTQSSDIQIQNSKGVSLVIDASTGLIKSIGRINQDSGKKVSVALDQNFYYYKGMVGNNEEFKNRSSGAYIFRPNGTEPIPIASQANFRILKGDFVTEVHQTFSSWVSQVIRLYDNADAIEFEWLVGPIPIEDNIGKEIITRYSSDIKSNSAFYTDANGREVLKRRRNSRETWTYQVNEPVAGNYYPVNSRIMLSESYNLKSADVGNTLIVMNDRAQGGTSMNDGELELMLHRRLLHDDAFGVGEPLNETQYGKGLVVRGKHWLVLAGGETQVPVTIHRRLGQEIYRLPLFTFQDAATFHNWKSDLPRHTNELGINLASALPENIHLLTLEKLATSKFLLRLEHIYESGEDETELSKAATVSVKRLQNALKFTSIRETTLAANQWKDEAKRFDWKTAQGRDNNENNNGNEPVGRTVRYEEGDQNIVMIPMEIKTFIYYTN